MRVGIIASNYLSIRKDTKKGTEIFVYDLIHNLVKYKKNKDLAIIAFASGDSELPVPIESIAKLPSSADSDITRDGKHVIFELALLSKAFSKRDEFDLFHVNIGNGDIAIPFAPLVRTPILVTLHQTIEAAYLKDYFSLFSLQHVFFVSISNAQQKLLPNLNYAQTIYNGVDADVFTFDPTGGDAIIWAGRGIPQKGLDVVLTVSARVGRQATVFPIIKDEAHSWLEEVVSKAKGTRRVDVTYNMERKKLIPYLQKSKLFLFPVQYEEPFGLAIVESMACGTPIVAYGRGSVPEIVKDGETGFIVNASKNDIRGDWVIKKTGIDGLVEAVQRLYAMSPDSYKAMRRRCRTHVEENFTIQQMVQRYEEVYERIANVRRISAPQR